MPVMRALALGVVLVSSPSPAQFRPTYPGRTATVPVRSNVMRVAIIGDSLAVGAPYAPMPFPTRLLQYLGTSTWTVTNYAVGGTRADTIAASYAASVQGKGFQWVVVEGGTNTVVDGTEDIGATAWGQMKPALDAALADGSNVVLVNIPPRGNGHAYSTGVQAGVDDYNALAALYAAAQPSRVKLVDLYAVMGEPGQPTELRTSAPSYDAGDGLHMTQAGQDVFACEVAKAITGGSTCE